jgi:large subunit ribosomal protein L6
MSTDRGERTTEVGLPSGVTASLVEAVLRIRGPLGEVKRDFARIPVQLELGESSVRIKTLGLRRKQLALVNTAGSVIRGMVRGVTAGYTYRLKVVYAHFPMSVRVKDREVLIENFYGERAPRIARIVGDSKVAVEGDDVVVRGSSLEDVGQTAANIEATTTLRRKDQRVFLDGVYVYEKKRIA